MDSKNQSQEQKHQAEDLQDGDNANKNMASILQDLARTTTPPHHSTSPTAHTPPAMSHPASGTLGGDIAQHHPGYAHNHHQQRQYDDQQQHTIEQLRYTIQSLDRNIAHARSLIDRCRDFVPNNSKGIALLRDIQEFEDSFAAEAAEHLGTAERRQWERERAVEQRERAVSARERAIGEWEGDAAHVMREFVTRAQAQHRRQTDLQERLRNSFWEMHKRQTEVTNRERVVLDMHRRMDPYQGTATRSTGQ